MKKKSKNKNFFRECFKESWLYIKESRSFIYFAILFFFMAFFTAFFLPTSPTVASYIDQVVRELLLETQGLGGMELIKFIFFNNLLVSFIAILFGIIPVFIVFFITIFQGYVVGYVSKIVAAEAGILSLWRLLPHGIFELSAIFISLGLGLKLGLFFISNSPWKELKKRVIRSIEVFLFIVLPLLLTAAIIEGLLIIFLN